eukprot:403364697
MSAQQNRTNQNSTNNKGDLSSKSLQSVINERQQNEYLRKSRTMAQPKKNLINGESLLSLRNQCQQCQQQYTFRDFQASSYRTCMKCQERSCCLDHFNQSQESAIKCSQCYTTMDWKLGFLLPPQTQDEAIQSKKQASLQEPIIVLNNSPSQDPYNLQKQGSTPAFESNQFTQPQQSDSPVSITQEQVNWHPVKESEDIQQQEQQEVEIPAYSKQFRGILYYHRSWYWILGVILFIIVIVAQNTQFHNNLQPKDQLGVKYLQRFEQYRKDIAHYFHEHKSIQSQNQVENQRIVSDIISILERTTLIHGDDRKQVQGHLRLQTAKQEITGYIEEIEKMYEKNADKITSLEKHQQLLIVQELKKFNVFAKKETEMPIRKY